MANRNACSVKMAADRMYDACLRAGQISSHRGDARNRSTDLCRNVRKCVTPRLTFALTAHRNSCVAVLLSTYQKAIREKADELEEEILTARSAAPKTCF